MAVLRTAMVAVGLTAIALGSVASGAFASGAATPAAAQSVSANVASGPFEIHVDAQRAAGAPASAATGTFTAQFTLAGVNVFTLHGPVTCLDVVGSRAGLFYPITSSSPPLLAATKSGVFIYFQTGSHGSAGSVGFVPVPLQSTKSCAPSLSLLPITSGSVTLHS